MAEFIYGSARSSSALLGTVVESPAYPVVVEILEYLLILYYLVIIYLGM